MERSRKLLTLLLVATAALQVSTNVSAADPNVARVLKIVKAKKSTPSQQAVQILRLDPNAILQNQEAKTAFMDVLNKTKARPGVSAFIARLNQAESAAEQFQAEQARAAAAEAQTREVAEAGATLMPLLLQGSELVEQMEAAQVTENVQEVDRLGKEFAAISGQFLEAAEKLQGAGQLKPETSEEFFAILDKVTDIQKEAGENQKLAEQLLQQQAAAATKIQALYRRHAARATAAREEAARAEAEQEAAREKARTERANAAAAEAEEARVAEEAAEEEARAAAAEEARAAAAEEARVAEEVEAARAAAAEEARAAAAEEARAAAAEEARVAEEVEAAREEAEEEARVEEGFEDTSAEHQQQPGETEEEFQARVADDM